MIKFPCKCGQVFNLTEDMAGGLVQCPRCGLLADVPTLGDLANITEDGIFKITDAAPITDNITIADLQEVFSTKTHDAQGREKDFRPDEEHYRTVGVATEVDAVGFSPKYDPSTGELIQPLEVKEPEPATVIPLTEDEAGDIPLAVIPVQTITGPPSIAYANNETRKHLTPAAVLLELFMPGNVAVIFFLCIIYFLAEKAAGILEVGQSLFSFMPILNIPLWLILAHFGCVIEDIGPNNYDELPRPFRHLSSQEDLLKPFFTVASALVLCYLPSIVIAIQEPRIGHNTRSIMLIMELIGSFFLPAILLTTVTGITYANLRPDRLLSVIRICGGGYLLSVGVLFLTLIPTALYLAPAAILSPDLRDTIQATIARPQIMLPLTAVSVYLTHFFCWHLGLLYRAHQEEFPWILQRHISKRRDPVMAPPRRPRRKPTD